MTLILENGTVVEESHEKNNIGNYIADRKLLLTSDFLMKMVKYKYSIPYIVIV